MFNDIGNFFGGIVHSLFGGGNNNNQSQNNQSYSAPSPGSFTSSVPTQSQFSQPGNDWLTQQAEEERKRREAAAAAAAAKAKADAAAAAQKEEQDKLNQQKLQQPQQWNQAVQKAGEGQNFFQNVFENLNGDNGKVANSIFQSHLAQQASDRGDVATVQHIGNVVNDPRNRVNGHALDGAVDFMNNTAAPIATNIPVMGGVINAGAGAMHALNPDSPDATNAFDRLNIGMSPDDLDKLKQSDPEQAARAEAMGQFMGWAGAPMAVLDGLSFGGAGTAVKTLLKEGATSDAGRTILKDTLSHVPVGMGIGGGLDTAGQNYMNNGDVTNFTGFDPMHALGSAAQGGLWSMVPEAKGHVVDMQTGNHKTVHDLEEGAGVGEFSSKPLPSAPHEVLLNELDQIKQQASSIPDGPTIEKTATQAGQIDDGISSPSRVQAVKEDLTGRVSNAKASLRQKYAQTLQGINDLGESLTPKPLATASVDSGIGFEHAAPLEAPQKPSPEILAKEAAPAAVPESAPVEPPSTAKSKAAAAQAVPSKPVKSIGPAEMSDDEIMQRFGVSNPGKTPDEIRAQFAANTKQLVQEKSVKQAQKDQLRMAKASEAEAAAAQARKDAGLPEKPKRDIFAATPEKAPAKAAETLDQIAKRAPTEAVDEFHGQAPEAPAKSPEKSAPTIAEGKKVDEQIAQPSKPKGNKKDIFGPDKDSGIIAGAEKTGERKTSQGVTNKKYDEISHVKGDAAAAEAAKSVNSKDFIKHLKSKVDINYGEMMTAKHLIDRVPAGSKDAKDLANIISEHKTKVAQTLGADVGNNRKTASSKQINAFYNRKLSNAGIDLSDEANARVSAATDKYTEARDNAKKLENEARDNPTDENYKALEKAQGDLDKLDRQAKIVEYKEALDQAVGDLDKGEKLGPDQRATLAKLKKDAHIFQYDAVDSSLLSATGTMVNNALNGVFGLAKHLLFSSAGAKAGKTVTKEVSGGMSAHGLKQGFKEGVKSINDEIGLRKDMNAVGTGKLGKVWGAYKNVVTTGNELSEIPTRMAINSQLESHYRQLNKAAGFKGEELKNRTRIDALTDPNGLRDNYAKEAYATQGMNNIGHEVSKDKKLETGLQNEIRKAIEDSLAGKLGDGKGRDAANWVAKWATRAAVGFPSVIFKSGLKEGLKHAPVTGWIHDFLRISQAKTAAEKSRFINEAVQHTGSGLTLSALGYGLTTAGLLTGSYPSDPNEQKRWQKEGKTEWSIKIGNDWFDLRKSLGAFALPLMMSAQITQSIETGQDPMSAIGSAASALLGVTPVDGILTNMTNWKEIISGQGAKNKGADMTAAFLRLGIPASGALNEIAKMSTAIMGGNELETKDDNWGKQFLNDLFVTMPGGGEAANLAPKKVDDINIASTSPLGRLFGAQKGYNQAGADENAKNQTATDGQSKQLNGEIDNASPETSDKIRAMLDPANQGLFDTFREGKHPLAPEKLSGLEKAIKGIADGTKGYDSKFAQDGDWDSQKVVLDATQSLMKADPQTKPSDQLNIDQEVKRVDLAQQKHYDPKTYALYRNISRSEWNNMLDPTSDQYDPQTAGLLYQMDQDMTAAGVSRNGTGQDPTSRPKYELSAKNGGKGGGSGKNQIATNVTVLGPDSTTATAIGPKYTATTTVPNLLQSAPAKPADYKKSISVSRGVNL